MKLRIIYILLIIVSMFNITCKKVVTEYETPFSISNHNISGLYSIDNVFTLKNNTFVLVAEDRKIEKTIIYHYNEKFQLIDSVMIPILYCSNPIVESDNSFIVMGESFSLGGFYIYKFNSSFEIEKSRNITSLFISPKPDELIYFPKLGKLSNNTYIVSSTYELLPQVYDRVITFCVKDLFKDSVILWSVNPNTYSNEWTAELHPFSDSYGNFYTVCSDRRSSNVIRKYNQNGGLEWILNLPFFVGNFHFLVEDNRLIYSDHLNFYTIDTDGNITNQIPYKSEFTAYSDLFKKNNHYYFCDNLMNSDGRFLKINKYTEDLKYVKSNLFGNRGTNLSNTKIFIIGFNNGQMIAITFVENPDLTQYDLLFLKFNDELELGKK